MANIESKQIKELDALTSVNDDDLLLIQTADGETKNIKNKNFMIPILNKVPQDNILANGGFNIWSRGENIVADNAYIECADKWLITDGTASKTFINSKSAIKITKQSNAREINLQQKVKNIQGLKGNKYTLSWRSSVDVDMNVTVLIFSYKQNGSTETFYSGSESYSVGNVEDHKITFEIPNTIDNTCEELYVRVLRASNQSTPQNIILFDVKLELGSVATPFTPKPISQELADCQCYCQAQQLLGLPFRFGTNFIQASISTPVTMRAIPTLVGDIDDWQIYNNNAVAQTGFTSANITSKCNGSVNISFNKPNHGLKVTDGIYFTTSDVILDAEIY